MQLCAVSYSAVRWTKCALKFCAIRIGEFESDSKIHPFDEVENSELSCSQSSLVKQSWQQMYNLIGNKFFAQFVFPTWSFKV